MLSRVAERIYWLARYLERIENTSRLVSVYANLLFDLPRGVDISWYNLVVLNSSTEQFGERYKNRDERNVIKFLLADDSNHSSMMSSIKAVRENIRTTRDVVPAEAWELVNEMYMFANDQMQRGINRGSRHEFISTIIESCQQINGLLSGTMSQDAGWEFLRLGRNLERSDMTTRIIDAGVSVLLHCEDTGADIEQIVWGNVLASLTAQQAYRRTARAAVKEQDVVRFVLEDEHFPRTVNYCIGHMIDGVKKLPQPTVLARKLSKIRKQMLEQCPYDNICSQAFRDYLNDLQLEIASLHQAISKNWFALK